MHGWGLSFQHAALSKFLVNFVTYGLALLTLNTQHKLQVLKERRKGDKEYCVGFWSSSSIELRETERTECQALGARAVVTSVCAIVSGFTGSGCWSIQDNWGIKRTSWCTQQPSLCLRDFMKTCFILFRASLPFVIQQMSPCILSCSVDWWTFNITCYFFRMIIQLCCNLA